MLEGIGSGLLEGIGLKKIEDEDEDDLLLVHVLFFLHMKIDVFQTAFQ